MANREPLFDAEAKSWQSLYDSSSGERWGLFQKYAQKRVQARLDLCFSLLPSPKDKDVIELGCGPGYYGMRLMREGARWTGADLSEKMVNICRKNTGSNRLVRANVLSLPFGPDCCDILLCIGVLSYLKKPDISSLFLQAYNSLRPGGILLTQTVRFDPLTWVRCRLPSRFPRPFRIPGPFYPRNPNKIKRLLEASGFSIERVVPYKKFVFYPAGTVYLTKKKPGGD